MSEQSEELKRIANALEEILRLVKLDQEDLKKDMEKESE
jgi:predicted ribonuclease toxin of YeeF-YezG toxin-antitoxin module